MATFPIFDPAKASSYQGGDYREIDFRKVNLKWERRLLNIDARQRDPIRWPNRNNFGITLPEGYRNVLYAKLISAEIPVTDFNVHEGNNVFTLAEVGFETYNIEIPPCDYDINTFIAVVENIINTLTVPAPPQNAYSLSVECGKLVLTGVGPATFQLLFQTGEGSDQIQALICNGHTGPYQIIKNRSAREVMGFDIQDYTSDGNGQIFAPFKVDLTGETYMILKVYTGGNRNAFDAFDATDQSSEGAFFVIPLTAPRNTINYITNQYLNILKTFTEPLSWVKELRFEFLGYYGRPYNFNGHDPALQLELGVLI